MNKAVVIFSQISEIDKEYDMIKNVSSVNSVLGSGFRFSGLIFAILVTVSTAHYAAAQLSQSDIARLQRQALVEGWTFKVGENDATQYALNELCGLVEPDGWWIGAPFDPCLNLTDDLPAAFDWRDYDGCTSIKNQGGCGSCWAFSTVGAMECAIKIMDGVETDLSEQWLVSCNTNGWSCAGGWFAHDYHQNRTDPCGGTGTVRESDFPYTARDEACRCMYPHEYYTDRWSFIGFGQGIPQVDSIKQAILTYGPVSCAVYVDSSFSGYNGGVFSNCKSGGVNHAVVLVGWDDSQGTDGVWIMRNSWGPGWGEDGYMRIEYGCSSIGYGANYVDYAGKTPLNFSYPDGLPEVIDPMGGTRVRVQVEGNTAMPLPDTGNMYIKDGTDWLSVPMDIISDNLYEAVMPSSICSEPFEYYFTAQTDSGYEVSTPYMAMDKGKCYYTVSANSITSVMQDNFETDNGWQVDNSSLTGGRWERAVPNRGGNRADPVSDYDGSGMCFVTGAGVDDDVEGGPGRLISPIFDLEGRDAFIRYARWFDCHDGDMDNLTVEISSGGAHWVLVEKVGSDHEWYSRQIRVSDYVAPTSTVQIRFTVSDIDSDSVTEAGIDGFSVDYTECNRILLKSDPLIRGEETIFTVNEATPDMLVYFVYSFQGKGSTYIPGLDVTLELNNPQLIGQALADNSGTVQLVKTVPLYARLKLVWLQAAQSKRISNIVLTQIN